MVPWINRFHPFRKKKIDERGSILRGVFEENLAILGRGGRPTLERTKTLRLKRMLLLTAAGLMGFLINAQYRGPTSLSRTSAAPAAVAIRSAPRLAPAAQPVPENGANVAEFKNFENSGNVPLSSMLDLGVKRIVIDAGHGGSDLGTIGQMGTREKDITLDVARRLQAHLIQNGFSQISMTRQGDSFVALQDRVTFAKEAKADLFISIHVNYLPGDPTDVVETFYFGPSKDEKTLRLAAQENTGSEYGLSDFKAIVEKLGKTMKLQESRELAKSIQTNLFLNSMKKNESIRSRGVKRAPFVVLLGLDVPSVLAEVSCMSNAQEERDLNSETHRENVAGYLADGIVGYLNKRSIKNGSRR
jgi:N-acetylmuramoyl-L-alanine amidase